MNTTYLADKSALVRLPHPAVEMRLRPLLEEGLLATCAIVDLEMLHSARNLNEYEAMREERTELREKLRQMEERLLELESELRRLNQQPD